MIISVEISYYAFQQDYFEIIGQFISEIEKNKNIEIKTGDMSSIVSGEFDSVLNLLQKEMKPFLEKYPSVFLLKISNACIACKP